MELRSPDDGLHGLAPARRSGGFGIVPNAAHQTTYGFLQGAPYELAIVEFDDQGRCHARAQMDAVAERLDRLRLARQDVVVIVFVHGWKHDARSDDDNLSAFRRLLAASVNYERQIGGPQRPVLGLFIGWRGLSAYGAGGIVADLTFWRRQSAALRVADGSVRELFGRLRHYRQSRREDGGAALLAIAGHSFGGAIVVAALAQSLIEAASVESGVIVPRFADLVLAINPAIEGRRFLPIYDLISAPSFRARLVGQLPVFVCVQAENDSAVGKAFPLGNALRALREASRGPLEAACVAHGLGFIDAFRTHALSGPGGKEPFVLDPPDIHQPDPFWVVRATPEVIDGHNGIWQEPFLRFLAALVFSRLHASHPDAAMRALALGPGRLAAFARDLPPLGVAQD